MQMTHHVGRYQPNKVRPIVSKFACYPDKERIRKKSEQLKGTPFGISEQNPKQVMEFRIRLIPIMNKKCACRKHYVPFCAAYEAIYLIFYLEG
ncbi:hypothetical protein DPMN_025894 [Dreissena polymorpha]|uniref:Uncharacterized protein n=1 Tax=Dreissena polymorpha TaxID=45954 RepID=A0A9D4GAB7_DREPO|nr:hypothetical protein DPMN_141613 [Dreissena polymorpha]KAH3862919.1 hypothetical protein DPMN_025894 [Dreissena polymorpha]